MEIVTETADGATLRDRLAGLVQGAPVDLAVLPTADRRKRLLMADMDSTIITVECLDELADHVGLKPRVAAITRRAMNGEIDFAAALRERVALLRGLDAGVIDEILRQRVRATPGAATLVRTMRAHGAFTALVSGGFTAFTGPVRARLGFDHDEANELAVEDGLLTGGLIEPIRDASSKRAALLRLAETLNLPVAATLAVGDGANDLPMIATAGLGVAFRPHPRVAAAAPHTIRYGDLTALLHLQGYAASEFVAG